MFPIVLAILFPLFMVANNESIDLAVLLTCGGFALAGIWCCAYFSRYRVTLNEDGLTVDRLFRAPFSAAWRDVVSVSIGAHEITLRTTDDRSIEISAHFPGYDAVETEAARRLPDTAFGSPTERPIVTPTPLTDEDRVVQHRAKQRSWLLHARNSLVAVALMFGFGLVAGLALKGVDELPPVIATPLAYVLAITRSMCYGMGFLMLLAALLYFIMAMQEAWRARRRNA